MEKQINRDQLVAFAKRVYQQACFGHLDLMEGFCEAASSEFFNGLSACAQPVRLDTFPQLISVPTVTVSQEIMTFDSQLTITNTTDVSRG